MKKFFSLIVLCLSAVCSATAQTDGSASADYTDGVFVINEDWYGHNNSTINFLTSEGEWIYRVIQHENPGTELGASACYATIYGGRMYIISKQKQDSSSKVQGAQITVCDAVTMKVIKQIKDIDANEKNIDGRAFLAVDCDKAYVGTNNGIYILDLKSLEIKGKIEGTENEHTDTYGKIYLGQTGSMLRINEKVYALHQDRGLLVIDAATDKVTSVTSGPEDGSLTYGSAVMSKDGSLWLSVSDRYSGGTSYNYIMRYDPSTGDTLRVTMPEGINPPSNSWFAWSPDGFCASTKNNVLYWNTGNGIWFSNNNVCKYDIDNDRMSVLLDFNDEDLKIYGCSMRIDPVSDNLFISLFNDPSIPEFVFRKYDNNGNMLAEYPMIENYWFPGTPVFPDNAMPVAAAPALTEITDSKCRVVSLDDIASDGDNMSAAMVKSISEITDRSVVDAVISNGDLRITPLKDGSSNVVISINSNGRITSADVAVNVSGYNGIDSTTEQLLSAFAANGMIHINNCEGYCFTVYDMSGSAVDSFTVSSDYFERNINLTSGVYILKGYSAKEKVSFKLNIR